MAQSQTPDALRVADVLERAADRLSKPGVWTQGAFSKDRKGGYDDDLIARGRPVCWCALGGIASAAKHRPSSPFRKNRRAYEALKTFEAVIGEDGPDWNDASGRTQAEVVAKLREAAALARESAR